MSSISIRQS